MDRYVQILEIERKGKSYSVCQRESDEYYGLIKTSWLIPSGFVDEKGYSLLMASSRVNDIRIGWQVDWQPNIDNVK